MERLTKKELCSYTNMDFHSIQMDWHCIYNKLAEVEDFMEKNNIEDLKQLENTNVSKFQVGQEVYYLDYKYSFEPFTRKYLAVKKGVIQDVLISEGGCSYNFMWDNLDWINSDNVFKTQEEAEEQLKLRK